MLYRKPSERNTIIAYIGFNTKKSNDFWLIAVARNGLNTNLMHFSNALTYNNEFYNSLTQKPIKPKKITYNFIQFFQQYILLIYIISVWDKFRYCCSL